MKHFLRLKEVSRITGIPRSSLYELMRDDSTFPKLVSLNKRTKAIVDVELTAVDRPRGVESKLDLPLSTPIPGSDGHDTLEGALTLGEIIRGEWQAEDAAQERFEDFELERAYRVARIILNREELHIFLCRYRSPPKKLRELSEELGLPIKRIWKIAQRALRKVVERMRHEDET